MNCWTFEHRDFEGVSTALDGECHHLCLVAA